MTILRCSRRGAVGLLAGACWPGAREAAAADTDPVRLGISETQMAEVNLNDARAAIRIWVNRLTSDRKIPMDNTGKLVYASPEILEAIRKSELDAVAINILEYRQVADQLDSRQIVCTSGASGPDQYVVLVRRNGPFPRLADLRGCALRMLKAPNMCVAPAWLFTLLAERRLGSFEQFFGSVTAESKAAQVVLPVFFGKADACLTARKSFDTICELNPQVGKDLVVLEISPAMVVGFFIFRRNYRSVNREKIVDALSGVRSSPTGQQLNTLFQFDEFAVRGPECLSAALGVLNAADLARGGLRPGARK